MPATFPSNPLKRPFPDREFDRGLIMGHLRTAIFIFAALYVLRPFGMDFGPNAFAICLGYGLVTFLVAVTYSYVTEQVFGWHRCGPNWTLGKWILDCAAVLLLISLANFIYHNFTVGWGAFSWVVLVGVTVPTVLIGLFPIAMSGVLIQMQAERNNQRAAGSLARFGGLSTPATPPTHTELVSLTEEFALDPATLLFCESRQNYVRVLYLDGGAAREETIRTTLSALEEKLVGTTVRRCHRSYLVNTAHVTSARGNAQGLRLNLVAAEEEVPVSRRFVAGLREEVLG
ncbi:LytTR family DNA-binding domain-containing protein [Lewinella sp. 4G2]|uniref:LytTR family DNA-binding domain-containing protein n=1 Tax=Lewinella sp. 4G2 TaxID=1803372 RepID=UPI0007B47892|nr:LytTR family DNA-binding domain-containing protein [Lewinella sp. 4G2]OAV44103.1 hypothetical protein A3850_006135 [Lewinella sp. 4G2]